DANFPCTRRREFVQFPRTPGCGPGVLFFLIDANRGGRPPLRDTRKPGATMPKMKTHKASKKRFRVTATGKLKRKQAGKKHLNSPKTGKRKRHLRGSVLMPSKFARKYIKAMGGDA